MGLVEELPKDNRFVTYTDWHGYLKYLEAVGDSRGIRITYDRGFLEIVTVSVEHERMKKVSGALLEHLALHLGVPMSAGGNMTFKRQDLDRGLEPDECYWFANYSRFGDDYDPVRDPPPDLVVEIDITRRSTRRMGIYANMGVPEVWRYARRKGLRVFRRNESGLYEQHLSSPTFPQVSLAEIRRHLDMAKREPNLTAILQSWRDYLRLHVPDGQ